MGCGQEEASLQFIDQTPNTTPEGSPPAGTAQGTTQKGCLVTFSSNLVLMAKLAPGASPSADPTGLIAGEPKPVPPILLHFDGTQVTMNGDDFQPASLQLGSQAISVRQKSGSVATGTYDPADGSIQIDGVQFEITSPLEIPLPDFSLTTETTGGVTGSFGNLSAQGQRLDANSKHLALVGGFQIAAFPLAEFVGAAVTVSFDGTVDTIPTRPPVRGGRNRHRAEKSDPQLGRLEFGLSLSSDNTRGSAMSMPQSGVDQPTPGDAHLSSPNEGEKPKFNTPKRDDRQSSFTIVGAGCFIDAEPPKISRSLGFVPSPTTRRPKCRPPSPSPTTSPWEARRSPWPARPDALPPN
jgi:hypothetical protein